MIHYRWISAIIGFIIALAILWLIRRDHIHPHFTLWWLAVACGIIVFSAFPTLIDTIGNKLGISYPPVFLIIIALGLIAVKMLKMDMERSDLERRLRRLTQRLALFEGERDSDSDKK